MEVLERLVRKYQPDAAVEYWDTQLVITCKRSLFKLHTLLQGAIDMYNAVYCSSRIIVLHTSKNRLEYEYVEY